MPAQVILAFANDTGESLKYLKHENDMVYGYLNRISNNIVNPVSKPGITINELFDEFESRKDQISIFHFSGHAGQLDLMFSEGKVVSGEGVAQLMKHAPNIELVFLNGCATKDLVRSFHDAGVKRVIATSKKVFDDIAAGFSIKFYSSLSQFSSVEDAFDYAKAYMVTARNEDPGDKVNARHISTGAMEANAGNDFPYSIYYKPVISSDGSISNNVKDYEKYDLWRFEDNNEFPIQYNPCIELLKCIGEKGKVLVDFLRDNNPNAKKEIREFAELHKLYKNFIDGSQDIMQAGDLSEKVIGLFPRPLGIIMRQMVSTARDIRKDPARYYSELLKYQLHFYDVMLKLSCFTMLSDLYEVIQIRKKSGKELFFDKETHNDIIRLLSMEENDVIDFNYRELIRNIRQKIIDNEKLPFVGEYMGQGTYIDNGYLEMAHEIIKIKKLQYASGKLKNGIISSCKAVEDELANIFKEVYFILRYDLLVIRNVEAIRVRFKEDRTYQHQTTLLRGNRSPGNSQYDITNDFTENYSVIMVKGLNSIINYLSLSPFVIDKCVLTSDESSQLFYYSHFSNGVIVYDGVEDSREKIEIEVKDQDEDDVDDNGDPVLITKKTVPYVEVLAKKDRKLNKLAVTARLRMIYDQFCFFKEEMEHIKYTIK